MVVNVGVDCLLGTWGGSEVMPMCNIYMMMVEKIQSRALKSVVDK